MSRFLRTVLLNTGEDCDWLRSTHLKAQTPPPFGSFLLEGNDDAPARVGLFRDTKPAYNSKPIAMYVQDADGNLELQEPEIATKHAERTSVVFLEPTEKKDERPNT